MAAAAPRRGAAEGSRRQLPDTRARVSTLVVAQAAGLSARSLMWRVAWRLPIPAGVMTRAQGARGWCSSVGAVVVGIALAASSAAAAPPGRMAGRLVVRERAGLSAEGLDRALRQVGARRLRAVPGVGATVIEADEAQLAGIEAALRRSGLFSSVERDHLARIAENDPYFSAQWGLPRTGAPLAWTLSTGAGVTVAVVDTGIEATHPDLQGRLLPGYDFLNGDADPRDDHGHGTRMTGIIAAARDNGEGVVGISPDAMILPVKALDAQGYGPYSAVANGIIYAVDQGARVVNLSLAGAGESSVLQAAVDYAVARDVVLVAATGNHGTNLPFYPAAATGAVAVAAVDDSDSHPTFSNSGAWVSFAAPGVDVVTTTLGGAYTSSTGTSPAAAFGSGVFALLFAANPEMTRAEAIARVENGSVDLGLTGWDPYFGWGRTDAYAALVPGQTGAPRVDGAAPTVSILSPTRNSLAWGMVPVDVVATDDVAIARVELFIDNRWYATATTPPYSFVVDAAALAPGKHKLRAYAYDTSHNVSRTRNTTVLFTPGTGLLVTRATAKPKTISISARFALPAGVSFDPATDDLDIALTSADGTVLSATASAGTLTQSTGGKMQGTVNPTVPTIGSVRVTAKGDPSQPIYTLKIKASNLSGMTALDPQMSLAVRLGDVQLSQSLPCRVKSTALLYP